MRDAQLTLARTIISADPLVLVLYHHAEDKEHLAAEIRSMFPSTWASYGSVAEALRAAGPGFLSSSDESAMVHRLAERREAFVDHDGPLVVFLLRNGNGLRALAEHPGLSSWLQGRQVDPWALAQASAPTAEKFEESFGESPKEWLAKWRAQEIPDTIENRQTSHVAWMLAGDD